MIALLRFLFVPRYRIFTHRRVVRKRLIAVFTVGLAVMAGAAFAMAGTPAALRPSPQVEGRYVMLGDLFEDSAFVTLPEARRVVVATAPAPGEQTFLEPLRLRQLAAEQGLDWPNAERLERITVVRASQLIGASAVEAALSDAIAARGTTGTLRFRFAAASPALHVPVGASTNVAVDSLEFDNRSGQFRASVRAPAEDSRAPATILVGRAYEVTKVPVMARDIQPGEKLAAQDITYSEMANERLGQNTLTDASGMVGMMPRRMLRAGQPLRLGDLTTPIVVSKNDLLSMIVRVNGMTLTAQGRALEDGALNASIRVINTHSKRTVQAIVTGPGEVSVQTGQAVASLH